MSKINLILILLMIVSACSKEEIKAPTIKETRQDLEIITAYKEAYNAIDRGDPYFAAKKFLDAELLFPQSEWAPKSALMASYSYYLQNFYAEAVENLQRYLKTYQTPNQKPGGIALHQKLLKSNQYFGISCLD